MPIDPIEPNEWPKSDTACEAAFGRFIIAWNVLEREIDMAIQELYDLDFDLAMAVTANLGTKLKLDIFQAAFHILHEYFSDFPTADVDRLVSDTGTASGEIRTVLLHGQPFQLSIERETLDVWLKARARKGGVKGPMFHLTEIRLNEDVDKIKMLVQRWHAVRQRMLPGRELREFAKRT